MWVLEISALSMPQTLLAVLALVIAGALMLGQNRMMNDSVQNVIEDEFDVVIPGVMLRALEFADSRAFDDATTPEVLRDQLSLGGVIAQSAIDTLSADDLRFIKASDFAPVSRFGRDLASGKVALCDFQNLMNSRRCDDISDLHTLPDSTGAPAWHTIEMQTSAGDGFEVEVRVEVNYVELDAPDTPVDYPTFHKRVDVFARSPLLMKSESHHGIQAHRIISFDPVVAAEYLRRNLSLNIGEKLNAELNKAALELAEATEAERIAGEALNEARALAERANLERDAADNALVEAQDGLSALQAAVADAEAALAAAQAGTGGTTLSDKDYRKLQDKLRKAQDDVAKQQREYDSAREKYERTGKKSHRRKMEREARELEEARADAEQAQQNLNNAQSTPTVDAAAVAAAELALSAARSALQAAQEAVTSARNAANEAGSRADAADVVLSQALAAYQQAQQALADAIDAYEDAQRRADYSAGQ